MNTKREIPRKIITTKPSTLTIGQLTSSYDPENYDNAITKYRKPSYQRALCKPDDWCKQLVDSVLKGFSTGAITLSRWVKINTHECGKQFVEEFYNVEDGQTRLNAYMRFQKGEFHSSFGSYEDVKDEFDNYHHSVIVQEKANPQVRDSEYFRTLNENFSLLQEGTNLTADDRYWVSVKDEKQNFPGSPLVNYTLHLVNDSDLSSDFKELMGVKNLHSKTHRRNLSNMIAFVSGCLWGSDFANIKYFKHVPKLYQEITYSEKKMCENYIKIIFNIIKKSKEEFKNYPRERFKGYFVTTQKFTGSMINELHEYKDNENENENIQYMKKCWIKFITEYRKKKQEDNKTSWLNDTVYNLLGDGNKRNSTKVDFKKRQDAVKKWYEDNYTQ